MVITIKTTARTQLIDITSQISEKIRAEEIANGLCFLFVPHTTAAITINESADPSVAADIETVMEKLIPWKGGYQHLEGNSAAHVKSTLVGVSELVIIENSQLLLGTWQGIFFCEFDGPRTRNIHLKMFPFV